jgi:PAS domain S-box-containing protein
MIDSIHCLNSYLFWINILWIPGFVLDALLSHTLFVNFIPLTIFNDGLIFLIIGVIALFGLFIAVKYLWRFSIRKEVQKKISEQISPSLRAINTKQDVVDDDDDTFFSSETINYLKNRYNHPLSETTVPAIDYEPSADLTPSANRYREFAQMLPDIVFECDLQGNLIFLNNAAFEILKINSKTLKQEDLNIFNFLHPDDVPVAKTNLQRISENRKRKESEYRICENGKVVMQVIAYTLPVIRSGKLIGIRGLLVDISQRKKNEETIQTLQDIVSHVGLGINVFVQEESADPLSFRLEVVNEASGRLMRFSSKENIGKRLEEISPLLRQKDLHTVFHKVLKSGQHAEIDDFIYQPDPLQPPKSLNLRVFPLPHNRIVLLMEDITTKKKAEENLKMTSFGIENAGDIILWIDENARIVFANGTACRKYGFTKEQLMGMTMPDVDSRITMMQWYELIQILETKPSLIMESINKTNNGETFPVELSINKFVFDGKKNYFAFVRDISERKKNDELEQKIQVARKSAAIKQQFLANMSHEIRTPMTGIMGMTSLLTRTNLSPAQMEYVRNIKISSENLLNIINDVLDLSKIEAGKMELKPNRIAFREFVSEIRELFQHQAQNKGIRFTTSIEQTIPAYVFVDDQRLKQVINNLLSNAFKFTDEGEISIKFMVEKKNENEAVLRCEVKDTGMGITDLNQKQVFEKFTQIDTSLIRPFEGTGLGLAICRELTQLMGGEISVESEIDKGSTFSFTFKVKFDKNDLEVPETVLKKDFMDMDINVLHVEDKLLNQKVVGFILFNAGCNVDFVKNGREAIEYYSPGKYDIILMDIQMPVMDGISAYKELKRIHGDKLCPVIGLSANALEGDAQKYIALGLDDYIVKPFQPSVLYEKLIKWAGKRNNS